MNIKSNIITVHSNSFSTRLLNFAISYRRSRRNLDNVNECSEDGETSTNSSNGIGLEVFKHHNDIVDLTEEELDLCEDVVSVRSFSSHSSGSKAEFSTRDVRSSTVQDALPKSRIVPRNPVSTSIPLKVYAR